MHGHVVSGMAIAKASVLPGLLWHSYILLLGMTWNAWLKKGETTCSDEQSNGVTDVLLVAVHNGIPATPLCSPISRHG
jgi:hypothetical protein